MEVLIHTKEGKLVSDDPFKRVGARGVLKDLGYKFIITEESIYRTKRAFLNGRMNENQTYVDWVRQTTETGDSFKGGPSTIRHEKRHLRIVNPGDPDYFEVEGY